ncbi:PepSY domain-containing protein [Fulvivirga ulvae]|uniref:PepSY domain-containing protein n=1 Tax=Fulvivirga ulvae TaxID=2904245 RepID=UPI001F3397FD|nr:PepSY domain-containing protein [Fulvivirga ulvae]UII33580.1 PepSY domain-containing protein [Fulvivirga ulvae]
MIISIWRYSHLLLAVSSSVFIFIASLTGIILAFEPVSNQLQGFKVSHAAELSLAETLPQLKKSYDEIFSLEVDANGFVAISAIDKEGNMVDFYIDPFTGEKAGELIDQSPIFEFATTLHRSLFLKSAGRFFVGLASFSLLLMAITGIILVVKRQQGILKFFSRIIRENFFQYAHVYLGRLALVPVIIITLTGTYLSLQRFEIIPKGNKPSYDINHENTGASPVREYQDFAIFQNTMLSDIRSLEFPFSDDQEDHFTLKLKTKELLVNQFDGEVMAESVYPMVMLLSELSMTLHTGRGSIWWSVVLGLASCSILFFIYSGFAMTLKRRRTKIKNKLGKDDCEFIILLGSETGSTIPFAVQLHLHLLEQGQSCFITEMNKYTSFKKMRHLIVITSTYGQGEAPANARKFPELYRQNKPDTDFTFAVAGFGSLAYPDFCQFAYDVDELMYKDKNSKRLLETAAINNRSWEAYRQWARRLGNKLGISIELPAKNPVVHKRKKKELFRVIDKTSALENPDDTFLISVESFKHRKLQSGDLLAIYTPNDPHERLYSISYLGEKRILLSVKRHKQGICSNYLYSLQPGDLIEGCIVKNKNFHFPSHAAQIIMISTGTGIAPFLGMLEQNKAKKETHLYWGGRTEQSFELYQHYISNNLNTQKLSCFTPVYSQAGNGKEYVQQYIARDRELMASTLRDNGVIMICGSIAMQREVIDILEQITTEINNKPLSYYQQKDQLLMDCY